MVYKATVSTIYRMHIASAYCIPWLQFPFVCCIYKAVNGFMLPLEVFETHSFFISIFLLPESFCWCDSLFFYSQLPKEIFGDIGVPWHYYAMAASCSYCSLQIRVLSRHSKGGISPSCWMIAMTLVTTAGDGHDPEPRGRGWNPENVCVRSAECI